MCIFLLINGKCCKPTSRVKVLALQAVKHFFSKPYSCTPYTSISLIDVVGSCHVLGSNC